MQGVGPLLTAKRAIPLAPEKERGPGRGNTVGNGGVFPLPGACRQTQHGHGAAYYGGMPPADGWRRQEAAEIRRLQRSIGMVLIMRRTSRPAPAARASPDSW